MSARDIIFVDGETSSQVEEFLHYIGELKTVEDLDSYVQKHKEAGLLEIIGESKQVLASSNEKKVESVYNQLFAIIFTSAEADDSAVVKGAVEEVARDIEANIENGALGLKVLNNLYNLAAVPSAKHLVFESIVKVADRFNLLTTVLPLISRLPSLIKEWQISEDEASSLVLLIRDSLDKAQLTNEAYETELVFLDVVTSTANASVVQVATSAVVHFVNLSAVCDLDALASLPTIQLLTKDGRLGDAGVLLNALLSSDYKAWQQFARDNAALLSSLGVDLEKASDKMRLLTIASLAAENLGQDVSFDAIAQAIDVDIEDVEVWIIDVIRAGLIQGKMNQVTGTVLPTRSTYRTFGSEQWSILAARLDQWKESLQKLQPVIANAKLVAQQQALQMAGQARVTIKE
ncbi:hypothetical protein GGI12_004609 [Dipsacomyces acuminosporus]|nr:hypothetical protein GGI12_004609 [Dipsacomyces acuminosporus]